MVVKEAIRAFLVKYYSYFSNVFRGRLLSSSPSTSGAVFFRYE
jgi:hypothetical protein